MDEKLFSVEVTLYGGIRYLTVRLYTKIDASEHVVMSKCVELKECESALDVARLTLENFPSCYKE